MLNLLIQNKYLIELFIFLFICYIFNFNFLIKNWLYFIFIYFKFNKLDLKIKIIKTFLILGIILFVFLEIPNIIKLLTKIFYLKTITTNNISYVDYNILYSNVNNNNYNKIIKINNNDSFFELNNNKLDNFNICDNSTILNNNILYSINDIRSPLENMLINLIDLIYLISSSIGIIISILLVRFILSKYKNGIINLVNKILKNKLNIVRIVDNILIYNLKFYNLIIKFNILIIIIMFSVVIYGIFKLYLNILKYVVTYNITHKIYNVQCNNVTIEFINTEYLSNLELILKLLYFNNIFIIFIFLLLLIIFIKYNYFSNENLVIEKKEIKLILIILLLLLFLGLLINLYNLVNLSIHIDKFVLEYSYNHIKF
uniref:Orf370 n=1 Tax=Flammulina velutipes TaxID=38945 RepID=M9MU39_FLAVE|nr:orf370 [Flammulina velutipes]AEO19640.1 orf370 [Flammulina velutipes]AEO19672.1 orf370 [Flammulina velutipes]AEO19703.1 orf370 [Flammulina velutipes]